MAAVALSLGVLRPGKPRSKARKLCGNQPAAAVEDTPGKVEVLEFFAYTCPHCAAMEPMVEEWARQFLPDVVLKSKSPSRSTPAQTAAQVYYVSGPAPTPHAKFFTAIHGEHKRLFDKEVHGRLGCKAWTAPSSIPCSIRSACKQVQRHADWPTPFRIDGTPSFAVGGKFMTSPVMAGNSYVKEVNQLIPMARSK